MEMFKYNGETITFQFDNGNIMINATQMAQPFGKAPWKWLELPSTKEYIKALSENRSLAVNQLVTSVRGGNNPDVRGNWFHEDLALEFARWLNPLFAMWCNDRIKELVKHGATALNPELLLDPDYVISVMTALKTERAEKQALQVKNELQTKELREVAPKVEYYTEVLQSESLISATELANTLGFRSAHALNAYLKGEGIIRKVNGCWSMCANYSGRGLAKSKTYPYTDSKGEIQTSHHLYFTEIGRKFLIDYHAKRNNLQSN